MIAPRVRVGIAGAGMWAERAHLPAFIHIPDVDVVGIADPDQVRAAALAKRFGIANVFKGYEEMLSSGIDALAIAAPVDVHHKIAAAALRSGVHVLCEKPLARNVEEAEELYRLATEAGVVTSIGFVLRYSPALQQLYELLQAGYVGTIHSLVYYSNSPQFFDSSTPYHWTMDIDRTGGGVFVEYGCHALDLGRWLAGEITDLCANARCLIPLRDDVATGQPRAVTVDDVSSWLANFSGGAEGVFHVSWSSGLGFGTELAVFGDRGTLGWRKTNSWPFAEVLGSTNPEEELRVLKIDDRFTSDIEWAETWRECFMGCLARQFVNEIRGAAASRGPTFHDGLRNQHALNAMSTSLRDRRWVSLENDHSQIGARV